MTTNFPHYSLLEDKRIRGDWRVERIHPAGECEVVIFSGFGARRRASEYLNWANAGGQRKATTRNRGHLTLVKQQPEFSVDLLRALRARA